MIYLYIGIGVVIFALLAVFVASYVCYRLTFCPSKTETANCHLLPEGEQYEERAEQMHALISSAERLSYEDVWMTSSSGLRLHAKYYEVSSDAPLHILFHGYKSNAVRDFSGGLVQTLESGANALLVDQRAHDGSEGKCLSFGVNERRDCMDWIAYASERFGLDKKILLVGISMGAATVLMASELDLPSNVVGILADSAYSSPKAILRKVLKERKYPVWLVYPFIKLGARLYGGFCLEEASAIGAVRKAKVPILFLHGDDDRFVPCEMSKELYEACVGEKKIVLFPKAGHGLGFLVDQALYRKEVDEYLREVGML